jgi:polysaccharide transporter, PST family
VSSLSKLRSNLNDFRMSWARALSTVSFFSSLAFALVAVAGQDLIVILLGEKWAQSGLLLSIFAVRGIAQISERTIGWLHVPLGRSDRWMRWGFVSAICQILAVSAGLPWGPTGVAVACAITMYLLFIPALTYAGQPASIGARDVLTAAGPPTAAGLIAVAIGMLARNYLLADVPALVRLFASSLICLSVYITVTVAIFKIIQPLQLALSVVRDFVPARLLRNS